MPKILALQRAESFILFAVQPVTVWAWIFRPFISLLYLFTNLVLRSIGLEYRGDEHAVHSPEELQLLVTQTARAGLLSGPERELVQRAFTFSDQTAGEVMVPRTEIIGAADRLDRAGRAARRPALSPHPLSGLRADDRQRRRRAVDEGSARAGGTTRAARRARTTRTCDAWCARRWSCRRARR